MIVDRILVIYEQTWLVRQVKFNKRQVKHLQQILVPSHLSTSDRGLILEDTRPFCEGAFLHTIVYNLLVLEWCAHMLWLVLKSLVFDLMLICTLYQANKQEDRYRWSHMLGLSKALPIVSLTHIPMWLQNVTDHQP